MIEKLFILRPSTVRFLKRFGDFSHGVSSTSVIAIGVVNATRLQIYVIELMRGVLS